MQYLKKNSFESIVLFILSPFLTVFFQIYFIFKGSKFALNTFIVILGLIGYIYVPTFTNDKTRYYERYEVLKNLSFDEYLNYLVIQFRPDFIFESLNFIFAKADWNLQILFFLINTFSIYTIFKISELVTNYFYSNRRFLCFLLILFSFAVQHLYSGIRFTFASCILMWGFYFIQYTNKKYLGVFILLLSVLTHFSMTVFVLVYFIFLFLPKLNYKIFFYISFLFLIIPKEILVDAFSFFDLNDGYDTKVDAYVNGDDFITQNFSNNISSIILYYARNIWIFVAYIYLVFQKSDRENRFLQLLYMFIAVLNIFYAFPTIFSRYLILVKFLFTIYIIIKAIENHKKKIPLVFLGLYFLTIILDLYVLRPNLVETFNHSSIINLFTILSRDVNLNNVIDNRP